MSFAEAQIPSFSSLISENIGKLDWCELIIEKSDNEKIQFIPDRFSIIPHDSGIAIMQYDVILAILLPNEISAPYKFFIQNFSKVNFIMNYF